MDERLTRRPGRPPRPQSPLVSSVVAHASGRTGSTPPTRLEAGLLELLGRHRLAHAGHGRSIAQPMRVEQRDLRNRNGRRLLLQLLANAVASGGQNGMPLAARALKVAVCRDWRGWMATTWNGHHRYRKLVPR
jgi:hypothetical protein